MHQQILGRIKSPYIVPGTELFLREYVFITHYLLLALIQMIICIVTYYKVGSFGLSALAKSAYPVHKLIRGVPVKPVVRINNLKINTFGKPQPCVYS